MPPVPVNVFAPGSPHEKQKVILEDTARFKLVRCGRKFRKTSLFVSWQLENALLCSKGLTYPVILPFQVQARESVWNDHVRRALWELTQKGVPHKVNETAMSIEFPTQARLKLLGADNDVALRSSSNWGAVAADEFDDWDSHIWDMVIRPNLLPHKAPAMVGGTPKGMKNMYKLSQRPEWKEFHFTSYDNPELDQQELDELIRDAKDKGDDYFMQEIMAEYVRPYGSVYKAWKLENYKDFSYDANLPLHLSMDFGVNDPTAIIWFQPAGSETRVIDYYEASNADIAHFVSVIRSKPYKEPELVTGDAAGKARTLTTGTSPIDELARAGIFVRVTDGLKIPEQIRATQKVIPSLFISSSNPNCERFRDVILNYHYPEKSEALVNQSNEIPVHDQWSHGARALEYYAVNSQGIATMEIDLPEYTPTFSKTGY